MGEFKGLIDLVTMKALYYKTEDFGSTVTETEIPEDPMPDAELWREKMLDSLGDFDETFAESYMGYLEGGGLIFHGTKALMRLHRGGFAVYPEQPRYTELPDLKDVTQEVHSTHDGGIEHVQNFLDCIRSRNTPNAPVAVGVAAARAGHLGNQALRSGQTVRA